MEKIFELPERFVTGEPTMLVMAHWNGRKHVLEKAAHYRNQGVIEKYASEAFDYVSAIEPRSGETLVLVNALGFFEHYDDNRNGDGFNEYPYKVGVKPLCQCDDCVAGDWWKRGWINEDEVITQHYRSFEKGGIYQHHVNKDPTRSLGRVEKAFLNSRMHRVELLLAIVNSRAPEWIDEIEAGLYSPVSMGCHVRWDVCANCGHRSPTRKDYCNHCKHEMRKIDPTTGVRNCALNPSARFFDISKVFRPADRQGFMIKKVAEEIYELRSSAELGEKVAAFKAKQASIGKLSTIQKVIMGEIEHAKLDPAHLMIQRYRHNMLPQAMEDLTPAGDAETSAMAAHPTSEVASTLAEKGAGLTTSELVTVLFKRAGLGTPDTDVLNRAVYLQPLVSAFFERYPAAVEKLGTLVEIRSENVHPVLAEKLGTWLEKRAGIGDYLTSMVGRSGLPGTQFIRDREPPKTDVLYVTDPHTGDRYTTTRGAVMGAHDEEAKADLLRRAGGTLALSGAYRLGLGRMIPNFGSAHGLVRHGLPLAAGAYTAHKLLNRYPQTPHMTSDEGYAVPTTTEMMKESSTAFNPEIPVTKYLDLLAFEYVERLGPSYKTAEDLRTALANQIARSSPQSTIAQEANLELKIAALFGDLEIRSEDPTDPPDINLDQACIRLGLLLVN